MKRVIVESPYAANEKEVEATMQKQIDEAVAGDRPFGLPSCIVIARSLIERNKRYARACLRDCLLRGESPYASHLLYTQPGVLDDDVPGERTLGIEAGFCWREVASMTVVYTDLGVSRGMELGIESAKKIGQPVEMRKLKGWNAATNR